MATTPPRRVGQGALEYLLLIGGAVLVGAVVLLLSISTIPLAGSTLNQSLNTYANLSGGNASGGPVCGDGQVTGNEVCDTLGNSGCNTGETCVSGCMTCTALPVVTIALVDGIANEDATQNDDGRATITRTGSTSTNLDVLIDADFGAAQHDVDFELRVNGILIPSGAPITIPANASSVDVDIIPLDDALVEGVEDAVITLLDPGAAATYVLSAIPTEVSASIDIIDDDSSPAQDVTLSVTDSDADEEVIADIGQYTITRTGTPAQIALPLDIDVSLSGVAANGVDYAMITTPITIPATQTSVVVDVVTQNDAANEGDEAVILTINSNANYLVQGSRNGTVTIHDNDGGSILPSVTLTATDPIATEAGQTTGTFTVTRNPVDASALPVTVNLSGTASNVSGVDYTMTGHPVIIPANQASATIVITPQDDIVVEGSETVIATIAANPLTYVVGNPANATITIQDDDFGGPPTPDSCTNYFTGNTNKPGSFPSYSSLFQQQWTWRRTLNPTTDIDVGSGPGMDASALTAAFNSAACGSTIVVHDLPASDLDGFKLNSKNCPQNSPIHIYFVNQTLVSGGGDVIGIDNVHGLVLDGMNNLTVQGAPNTSPRALFFIGHHTVGSAGTTSATRIIIKNVGVDGRYDPTGNTKTKWALFGENNTDLGFCNLDIHDIWWEHGFYFHTMAGNFEVVDTKIDNVGRTCVQLRNDWAGTPNTNYIIADNDCSRQRNGGAITADDPSGTWWIHGNRIVKAVQGFVSIDSQQQGYFNHTDGHVYFYDNKIKMGEAVEAYPGWGGGGTSAIASLFNIRDGGAKFYVRNNVFVNVPGATLNVLQKQYVNMAGGHFPNELTESNNNTFGLGHNSYTGQTTDRLTRWDTAGGSCFIAVGEWTSTSNKCGKPPQPYDAQSTFEWKNSPANNPAFTNLLNMFAGMP